MINLRHYQVPVRDKAIDILSRTGWAYLVMEERTGKTFTSFSIMEGTGANSTEPVLLLTSKGAKEDILPQFEKLDHRPFELILCHNDQLPKLLAEGFVPPRRIIIDECHYHGAFPKPSKRAEYLRELIQRAYNVHGTENVKIIFMSATPTPESYVQMYPQLNILPVHPFGTPENFLNEYVEVRDKIIWRGYRRKPRIIPEYIPDARKIFGTIGNNVVSLTRKQAGFISEPIDVPHEVKMDILIYRYIHDISNTSRVTINGHEIECKQAGNVKSKIHQLCGGTIKLTDNEKTDDDHLILDYTKAEYIRSTFAGKKIAIFYQFKAELELLKHIFPLYTTNQYHFQENPNLTFLGQFKSVREGKNLSTADHLVMYNIDYAYLSYRQSRCRHITFERNQPGWCNWIYAQNGLEQKIMKIVRKKENYTDGYFADDLKFFKENSPSQLSLF